MGVGVCIFYAFGRRTPKGPDGKPVRVPACGNCGYPVAGLNQLTCPECGADLRIVGIVTPDQRRPRSIFGAVIGWTLAMLVLGFVFSIAASTLGPQVNTRFYSVQANDLGTPLRLALHIEGQHRSVTWSSRSVGRMPGFTPPPDWPVTLRITSNTPNNAGALRLHDDGRYRLLATGRAGDALTSRGAVLAWLGEHGLDPTDVDVTEYARRADANAAAFIANNQLPYTGGGTGGGTAVGARPHAANYIVGLGVPFAVWLAGAVIIRRRDKRTVLPDPAPPA